MARPQNPAVEREQGKKPLNEVIPDVFSEYFSDLDTLQNAKRVTQKDLDKLDEAKRAIEDCERRAEGGIDEASKVLLGQLRLLFEAASINTNDRAEFVDEGVKKDGKEKKKKAPVVRREPDEKEVERHRRTEKAEQAPAERINVKQEALLWSQAVGGLRYEMQQMNRALFSYNDRAAAEQDEKYYVENLGGYAAEFSDMLDALGRSGATEVPDILKPVVADFALANEELAALRDRIARFDDVKREREEAAKSAEGLAKTFIESAQAAIQDIPRILALPSGTPEERFVLRTEIESMVRHFKEYNDLWKKEAEPHLPNGEEWLPAWQQASQLHRDVHRAYRGIKERRGEVEDGRSVDFEHNYAAFEGKVSVFRSRLLEAETKQGDEREAYLLGLQSHFSDLKHEWQELRRQAPRLTEAERSAASGQDSPVKQLDRAMGGKDREGGIEKQLKGLLSEKDPRVLRAHEVISDLARSVVRAHGDIWVAATRYPGRDGFLRRYLDGEVNDADPEFAEFVMNRERFHEAIGPLSVAYLQVSRERRKREAREERRRTREEERNARQQDIDRRKKIRHPWVVELRAREQDRFSKILYSESWKISDIRERRQIMDRVAEMSDEALVEKLDDAPAFRRACAELQGLRETVHGAETEVIEGRELHPDISKREAQEMVERYHRLRRLQNNAGKRLEQSRAWNPRVQDRFAAAVAFRSTLFSGNPKNVVRQAFREIAADPRELGPLMERWIDTTSERFALGEAIAFALETHPGLRRRGALRGLPKEFRLPREASAPAASADEESAIAADEAATDAEAGEDTSGFGADLGGGMRESAASLMSDLQEEHADQPVVRLGAGEGAIGAPPAYSAASGNPRTPEVAPVDKKRELLKNNESWKAIQKLLLDDIFWEAGFSSGSRATKLKVFRENGSRMKDNNSLRADRVADFEYALGFVDIADLERRVAGIREKYAVVAPAPATDVVRAVSPAASPETPSAVPVPGPTSSATPVMSSVLPPLRPDVSEPSAPSAPQSAAEGVASGISALGGGIREASRARIREDLKRGEEVTFRSPRAIELARADATLDLRDNPDGTVSVVAIREDPAVSAPRVEAAPVRPVLAPPREVPPPAPSSASADPFDRFFGGGAGTSSPEARSVPQAEAPRPLRPESVPVPPVRPAPRTERAPEPVASVPVRAEAPRAEIAAEAPREPHAEERVASWSRSIRNTVGRWFGGAGAEPRAAEAAPVVREAAPSPEVSRRTAGGVIGVLGKFFGFKAFADVPRYLPESFGDENARALLQADILDAMEANAATMKNVAGDPDRIHAANLDAAQRLDRAIASSALSNEAKTEMRNRVVTLQEKYADRTRENMAARSRELAGIVEQSVRVLEAPGRRGSPALRLLSKLPFGIGTNLAHGVGDFRKRFETAVSQGGDTGMVARVATVFRETWEEAMQSIRGNGSLGSRAMNTAEAVAMIGSAYGVSATVTALEQMLPSLRSLTGSERDEMARLAAEGRLNVQEAVDDVLPRAERVLRRTA